MKIRLLLAAGIISFSISNAQTWTTVGTPFQYNEGCGCTAGMNVFAVYNGNLYAGGWANNGSVNALGYWDGTKWSIPGTGLQGQVFVEINAMVVYNGELYVAGQFQNIGGLTAANGIAKWNGSSWSKVGGGFGSMSTYIYTMAVYNGNLYVGGTFDSAGGKPITNIAMWNGSTWSSVGGGVGHFDEFGNSDVYALATYNGNLYAGGTFDSAGGKPMSNLAMWNGSTWSSVGGGIQKGTFNIGVTTFTYSVYALCELNGYLYVGGLFDSTSTIPAINIAAWNGSSWSNLGTGLYGGAEKGDYGTYALYGINNLLYAGGAFDSAGGNCVNSIAVWNGSSWASVGSGVSGNPYSNFPSVLGFGVYNNNLYVAGQFDSAGGAFTGYLAEWPGPLSIHNLNNEIQVNIYPNPSHGMFTIQPSTISQQGNVVEVYNMLGEKVYDAVLNQTSSKRDSYTINLSGNPSGIYLYRIITKKGELAASGKLIIE